MSKYKFDKNNKRKNKTIDKKLNTENKFNHQKVRYTECDSEFTNKIIKHSHIYDDIPEGLLNKINYHHK